VESFSQTVFFGGVKQKPEIRLCSQAIAPFAAFIFVTSRNGSA
jgi:hypothetical protein